MDQEAEKSRDFEHPGSPPPAADDCDRAVDPARIIDPLNWHNRCSKNGLAAETHGLTI
jgi:hypothetical protein